MSQTPYYNPYFMPPAGRPAMGTTDSLLAFMQDGKIFKQTPEGPQQIGVTTKTYEDLSADYDSVFKTCQQYYDKLVELGVITPEPTQEELLKRQAEQLQQQAKQLDIASKVIAESAQSQKALTDLIADLRNEVASLKNENFTSIHSAQGAANEYSAINCEPASTVGSMERADKSGVANSEQLPELPKRAVSGDGGTPHRPSNASKRASNASKRAGGRNT